MTFLPPSNKVLNKAKVNVFVKQRHLPFDSVPVGMSFKVVKGNDASANQVDTIANMRTIASREGIKLGRVFITEDHGDCFEVYFQSERPEGPKVSKRAKAVAVIPNAEEIQRDVYLRDITARVEAEKLANKMKQQATPQFFGTPVGTTQKPLARYVTIRCPSCGDEAGSMPSAEFLQPDSDPVKMQVMCPLCDTVTVQPRQQFEE